MLNLIVLDLQTIPEGSSALPFEFEIPTQIPQSMDDGTFKNGKVLYSIQALIRTPVEDYSQQKQIYIKGILNLNAFPELSLPVSETVKEIVFDSCFSSSGKIAALTFSLKKQAFAPGEVLFSEVTINDSIKNDDQLFEMQLIQEVTLKLDQESYIRRRVAAKNDLLQFASPELKSTTEKDIEKKLIFRLKIPDNAPISFDGARARNDFVKINYFIRASFFVFKQ